MLIERLKFLMSFDRSIAQSAARAALDYIARTGAPVPDTDLFIENASRDDEGLRARYLAQLRPDNIPMRRNQMLTELGADSVYYQTSADKIIEVATIYMYNAQYPDAQSALSSANAVSSTCHLAELSAQVGMIQSNFALVLAQEKRVDAFMTTSMANELYFKRLTCSEITSYWRVKLLVIYANFLKQNYDAVVKQAYALANTSAIRSCEDAEIKVLDILNSESNKFIHKDEVLVAVIISLLLTRDSKDLNDIHSEQEFITLMGPLTPDFRPLCASLNSAKFAQFFEHLEGLNTLCTTNLFISRVWNDVKLGFRRKAYQLYLSLVRRVSVRHLSQKLKIPELELVREIKDLIRRDKLEFEFVDDDEIIEAVTRDKKTNYYDRLSRLAEQADNIESQLERPKEGTSLVPQLSRSSSPDRSEPRSYDPDSLDARLAKYGTR